MKTLILFAAICLSGFVYAQKTVEIELIAESVIPTQNNTLGGFSGIEYIKGRKWDKGVSFVMVSDKESSLQYITFTLKDSKIEMVPLESYPLAKEGKPLSIYPESVRKEGKYLFGTSEYGKEDKSKWLVLWKSDLKGNVVENITLFDSFDFKKNSGFEAFDLTKEKFYLGLERMNHEDRYASQVLTDKTHLYTIDRSSNQSDTKEYTLCSDINEEGELTIFHGLTDLIRFNDELLITLERTWNGNPQRSMNNGAIAIVDYESMQPIKVLNIGSIIKTDNVEGIALGPGYGEYKHTLVVVADNNFNKKQKNQVLIFGLNITGL